MAWPFHAPKNIYGGNLMAVYVDEMGGPQRVAKFLKVHETTVFRWLRTDKVPRAAVLALYWETQWGRSQIFTEQVNEIRLLYAHVSILQKQFNRARDMVNGMRRLHTGSANEPVFEELASFESMPQDTYGMDSPSGRLHAGLPFVEGGTVPSENLTNKRIRTGNHERG